MVYFFCLWKIKKNSWNNSDCFLVSWSQILIPTHAEERSHYISKYWDDISRKCLFLWLIIFWFFLFFLFWICELLTELNMYMKISLVRPKKNPPEIFWWNVRNVHFANHRYVETFQIFRFYVVTLCLCSGWVQAQNPVGWCQKKILLRLRIPGSVCQRSLSSHQSVRIQIRWWIWNKHI